MKSWTCFGQGKSNNLNSIICTIVASHFPWIINNTCSSLVVMKPQKRPNFLTIDFERQTLQETPPVGEMVTSDTQQFPHTFWNGGTIRLVLDNT